MVSISYISKWIIEYESFPDSPPNRIYPSKYFLQCSKPDHEPVPLKIHVATAFLILLPDGWVHQRPTQAPIAKLLFLTQSDLITWCYRLVTLLAHQLGDGTSHHYLTSPFRRTSKLSLLVPFILVVPPTVIETNEACYGYITFLIPSQRRETDEARINSFLRFS